MKPVETIKINYVYRVRAKSGENLICKVGRVLDNKSYAVATVIMGNKKDFSISFNSDDVIEELSHIVDFVENHPEYFI